jgi:hypothetical protein
MEKYHQFAPVAPIHILEELFRTSPKMLFGDYHLFLAHHTVEHPERFSALASEFHRHWYADPVTIIMDNSLVECGHSVDFNMVKEATDTVAEFAHVIPVLPDVMGSGIHTKEAVQDAYDKWSAEMSGSGLMLVLQGSSWNDFVQTANYFLLDNASRYSKITWVGIPRKFVEAVATRKKAVRYIRMIAPWVKIHLLGFSEDMVDDFLCAKMEGVRGIDSAVPVRHNAALTPTTVTASREPDWMENGILREVHKNNILKVRNWIKPTNAH